MKLRTKKLLLAATIGIIGFGWLLYLDWQIAAAVFLIAWSINIQSSTP